MASDQEINLNTMQSTTGGANLGQHWKSEKGLKTLELINSGIFEAVILQDHSMGAINSPDSLLLYGTLLHEAIEKNKAQTYLYLTWAREKDPQKQKIITKKYQELAQSTGAIILPVGIAWETAKKLHPDIELYNADGSHPSTLGTYLTACVIFGVLTNSPSLGLPHRLITKDKDGEKLYLNIQSEDDAQFCQKVADKVVSATKIMKMND
jgi:hypothetical protein